MLSDLIASNLTKLTIHPHIVDGRFSRYVGHDFAVRSFVSYTSTRCMKM